MKEKLPLRLLVAILAVGVASNALASSHREAPFITLHPKVDGTDFYMFNSYEAGRAGYVTIEANYQPLQDPGGAPNYFTMDPKALYEIHIDNSGDGVEDLTFQFRFNTNLKGLSVPVGPAGNQIDVPVAFSNIGPVTTDNSDAANVLETYTLTMVKGDRRHGMATPITDASNGSTTFAKPLDNIGAKSIPNYADYANSFVHDITIPGCSQPGKVFVGQRADPFFVDLGEFFDLDNVKYPVTELAPSGVNARNSAPNFVGDKNVTTLALEIPAECLTHGSDPVIGGWTTASLRQANVLNPVPQSNKSVGSVGAINHPVGADIEGGAWVQVSRLGMPLVNEVVIGLPDKDRFNSSQPKNDAQFANYVTNPSVPVIVQTLFSGAGVKAPNVYPRADLVQVFLTGVPTLNKPANLTVPSEMLRLNTSTPVTPIANQNDLGVLAGDAGGFPNGRRPIDDVVDITLRAAMGALLQPSDGSANDPDPASDASRNLGYTDDTEASPSDYLTVFPYFNVPHANSPLSPTP